MSDQPEKPPHISPLTDKDGEVRELTAEDMALFRPLQEVDPGLMEAMKAIAAERAKHGDR